MHVVIAGAGFGGLEVATAVAGELDPAAHTVTVVDRADGFIPGSAHLELVVGAVTRESATYRYRGMTAGSRVHFRHAEILGIDPGSKTVRTADGDIAADVLVVALGAELDVAATPGLAEFGYEFYTPDGAERAAAALHEFGGGTIVIGAAPGPIKCPPAPSALALRLHEVLTERGLRDACSITVALPGAAPIPPAPEASEATLDAFERCDIDWVPNVAVEGLTDGGHTVQFAGGFQLPCDVFLGVPRHRAPAAVAELCVEGWIPVDEETCLTAYPQVFAIGDVTSIGTPKAGAFAAGQGAAVAQQIVAMARDADSAARYDGSGACYMGFDGGRFARIGVTVRKASGVVPEFDGPSTDLREAALAAGAEPVQRWFVS